MHDRQSRDDAVRAPRPSGGDDSSALAANCNGDRDVHLSPGATYVLAVRDAISGTGFTGRLLGHGATLKFTYNGPWSSSFSAINRLRHVTVRDVRITAPDATLCSIFQDCVDLNLRDVTFFPALLN